MSSEVPPGWSIKPLGEVLTLQRGFDITRAQQRAGTVPVVSSGGIASYHDTAAVAGPGVVIGRKGTLGTVFYVSGDYWPHDTTLWVKDFHGNDPRFAYYFFKTLDVLRLDVGSANPTLNRNHVHQLQVSWPPLTEQKAISAVLGALDDKIECSRRLSALLAEAFALRFEAVFFRFIGREDLVESRMGPIPPGWEPGTVADFVHVHRSLVKGQSDLPYIGLDAMPKGSTVLTEWLTEDTPTGQAATFEKGDILFAKLRPYFKKVGVAPVRGRCSTEVLVLRPTDPRFYGVALGYVSSQQFIEHCVAVSRGTRMPRAEWKDASSFPVAIPPATVAAETTAVARVLYEQIAGLTRESRALKEARDHLLPHLISGRIRVAGAKDPDQLPGILEEITA
jgi:type I restriction enzyme S subunit